MRFIAAPWVRRTETPIAGISGSTGSRTAPCSYDHLNENIEAGYSSPPVVDRPHGTMMISRRDSGE
jgi:hypothetical protein